MARIIRHKSRIAEKRKKSLTQCILWCVLLITVFVAGLVTNSGNKANIFTIIAAVMSLPVAQHLVTAIAYSAKNKEFPQTEDKVHSLPDCCAIYINNIAVGEKANLPINYIIAAPTEIFILADYSSFEFSRLDGMKRLWIRKGIDIPVTVLDVKEWDKAINSASHIASSYSAPLDEFYISTIEKLLL